MATTTHISARLAWHDDGWNGKICRNPMGNTYCTGSQSYPGGMYEKKEMQKIEAEQHAGCTCAKIRDQYIPPCSFSINAFGDEMIAAENASPSWYTNFEMRRWDMPPSSISSWPYEEMYYEEDKNQDGTFNYETRISNVRAFIQELQPGKSLIFYYCNYSNPFSEDEAKRYVIVGISRLKKIGEFMHYEKATAEERKRYAGAFVWQIPLTSWYPEEGFRIPYHRYRDDQEALAKLGFFPENERPFKYGMRKMTDGDALEVVERALEIVDVLEQELKDTSEDWSSRRKWLQGLMGELWHNRGRYPGLPSVLNALEFEELNPYFYNETLAGREQEAYEAIKALLTENKNIPDVSVDKLRLGEFQDNWASYEVVEQKLWLDILPRFELTSEQITQVLSENRLENGITATLDEIAQNPYILSEQYVGNHQDDNITFARIDHGMLPSPDLGLEPLTTKGSAIRFRALCVRELKRVTTHTFSPTEYILERINRYQDFLPDARNFRFTLRNFESHKATLDYAVVQRKDVDNQAYLYLRTVFEDERFIEQQVRAMLQRSLIQLNIPVTERNWYDLLYDAGSPIAQLDPNTYDLAVKAQANVCEKIFRKPLSVLSGGAGTGKTTIIRSIIRAIEKAHGLGTSFLLLAPTGKAADRLRERTGKPASTIHSFLAGRGWLNPNFTLKREGGKQETDVRIFIIDECSMLDQSLVATLFRAINWHTVQRIILVGDPNQLPPIGVGKVFSDIVDWIDPEYLGELKENLRQKENSLTGKGGGILQLASVFLKEVNGNHEVPVDLSELENVAVQKAQGTDLLKRVQEQDFTGDLVDLNVVFWRDENELHELMFRQLVADLEHEHGLTYDDARYYELLNKAFDTGGKGSRKKADRFQVISPYRSELYGTESLNVFWQSRFNRQMVQQGKLLDGIGLFDKVLQFRNRPKSDPIYAYSPESRSNTQIQIFNGELGFTRPHNFDSSWQWEKFRLNRFLVDFEGRKEVVAYGKKLGSTTDTKGRKRYLPEEKPENNLELAYAISVHKAQGSEFERVYLVLPKHKKALLSKELLYAAITRAKGHLTIFAEQDIGAFLQLSRPEASVLARTNSSLFQFKPLPQQMLSMGGWYEEGKIHETLSSHMVRSKSEVIIANMLFQKGVPFDYEKCLYADDGTFYLPDFTILLNGETWYLEHLGRLDLPNYRRHWEKKEAWYNKHFPGRLIKTIEGGRLSKDLEELLAQLGA